MLRILLSFLIWAISYFLLTLVEPEYKNLAVSVNSVQNPFPEIPEIPARFVYGKCAFHRNGSCRIFRIPCPFLYSMSTREEMLRIRSLGNLYLWDEPGSYICRWELQETKGPLLEVGGLQLHELPPVLTKEPWKNTGRLGEIRAAGLIQQFWIITNLLQRRQTHDPLPEPFFCSLFREQPDDDLLAPRQQLLIRVRVVHVYRQLWVFGVHWTRREGRFGSLRRIQFLWMPWRVQSEGGVGGMWLCRLFLSSQHQNNRRRKGTVSVVQRCWLFLLRANIGWYERSVQLVFFCWFLEAELSKNWANHWIWYNDR